MADPTRAAEAAGRTVALQEQAALERRHWVRITYQCNNRCCFCLDAHVHHGIPFIAAEEVRREIDAGREAGATRLILSGGEASIHPDFVELVRYGREVGYQRVQTISNGRMFSYRRFLRNAVKAGLGEVTFSLHSHRARVHDRITGVAGAYKQGEQALRMALAEPRLIVSVDIVINRLNLPSLAETVRTFTAMGVREYDLLHLVPFGRAFRSKNREVPLSVELEPLREQLAEVFAFGQAEGLVIWTNRLPAPALEGYESMIQDPHKLLDEVRGRHEHMDRLAETGTALPCRDERCAVCHLEPFCDQLHPLQERVEQQRLSALRVSLAAGDDPPDLGPYEGSLEQLWIRAPDLPSALAVTAPGVPETWELAELEGLSAGGAVAPAVEARELKRIIVSTPEAAELALAVGDWEVKLPVDRSSWDWVWAQRHAWPPRLVVGLRVPPTLSACLAEALELSGATLGELAAAGARVEDLPPCLGGPTDARPEDAFVDLGVIDDQGHLDPDSFVAIYVDETYRTKSLRCRSCRHDATCTGLAINLVRAQGFGVLAPQTEK